MLFLYFHFNASATEKQQAIKFAVGRDGRYVPVLDLRNAGAVINAFRPKERRLLSQVHWLTT
jgi:hypothetical protein